MTPVSFLTHAQRDGYGRYATSPTQEELARFFHLTDDDRAVIENKRGDHSRLGFAVQLTTVRYLGTFPEESAFIPASVLKTLGRQLSITNVKCFRDYRESAQRWAHMTEIRDYYGYRDFSDPMAGFRLTRWLYSLCWTGTDRPGILFDRATDWLLAHKVLLPGWSLLERFVSKVRSCAETRLWRFLGQSLSEEQKQRLEALLTIPEGSRRSSQLDQLRSGPVMISGPSLVKALERLQTVRDLGITMPPVTRIPPSRITALARFANTAKVTAIIRLPTDRRMATLVAFIHRLEATAHDEALEILEILLHNLFEKAKQADKRARLRTLKDLDKASMTLATACKVILDPTLPDDTLRTHVFSRASREDLAKAVENVGALVRPPDDVYYNELSERYRSVRRYLPAVLQHLKFDSNPAGKAVVEALAWLRCYEKNETSPAPLAIISGPWSRYVLNKTGDIDHRAYTFYVLDGLFKALQRRDVFVTPSWRYADPRLGLLSGPEWEATRPVICRTLGLSPQPEPVIAAITEELDDTYRAVVARFPNNPAVRFEMVDGKTDLILSPLDKLDETPALKAFRKDIINCLPRVDLPEILLEIEAKTGFSKAFTHVTETRSRTEDLKISLCAALLAEACNTGIEPLVRNDSPALRRERLLWVSQNYIRDETLSAANAGLVSAQNQIPLAHAWGGGEVASADGLRFVVPVRTIHARPNPKYFGIGRGVTYYNLVSDQFTGLNAVVVPGTLRDSLVLLSVVLDQQTELQPTLITTDSGAYSDVIFGLFRLLGYRFSPRLADIGGTRFWRIDPQADYGILNEMARNRVHLDIIAQHWDDILRLVGSLKLGRVPATGIMRTLQIGDHPTRLAQALAAFGRIEKTLHVLTYLDDETKRRNTLAQLNRGESRHNLARMVFYAKRGELRQRYREGQEDQLSALGLVVNAIVLWNTIYMNAALSKLRQDGYPIIEEAVSRLSPLVFEHINVLGRYSFAVSEAIMRGELRPLRNLEAEE
ncbi:MAG: Tn3 family transposase [bacterium]